jgi:hypothetical protein
MFNRKQWKFCYNLGDDGCDSNSLVTTIDIASLRSLVSTAHKEERKKER